MARGRSPRAAVPERLSRRTACTIVLGALLVAAGCGESATETGSTTAATGATPKRPAGTPANPPPGDGRGGVSLEKIGDFSEPLYVAQPPADRNDLFVVEKTGRVRVVHDGEIRSEPYLDLSDEISSGLEQGLLSIAFAPDYEGSGLAYVGYTDTAGDTKVVEFRRSEDDPLVADPESGREVISVEQPAPNHNGGLVLFGLDGYLYVGLGDGGFAGDPDRVGQDLSTLLGKILRIDPRPSDGEPYTVPRSNPYTGEAGARPEIYSYGLRNPWRFSFDPVTGSLAIADVGQYRFEEVDLVARGHGRGANFGWSAFEGFARFNDDQRAPDAVPPVLVYRLRGDLCSVTGGYVVRDASLRSLYGRYVYGDYCGGELRSFTARPGRRATDDRPLGIGVPALSSFGVDNAGHVYATSLDGPVYRLVQAR